MIWQPVETAPKDGNGILGAGGGDDEGSMYVCWWESSYWTSSEEDGWVYGLMDDDHMMITVEITHWMPLPAPPHQPDN